MGLSSPPGTVTTVTDHLCSLPPPPPDKAGLPHRLRNDSGCGTRVTEGPGSSVVLEASYSGCFVTDWVSRAQASGTPSPALCLHLG